MTRQGGSCTWAQGSGSGIELMARKSEREKIADWLNSADQALKDYFILLPELLDNISRKEPALTYCFQQIEMAKRNGLYCLLMREYRTDQNLTWRAVDKLDITRSNFSDIYRKISGKNLPSNLREKMALAEPKRDDIMHGRAVRRADVERSILQCLDYSQELNSVFFDQVGFRPFGSLQGITSKRGSPQLNTKISRAVLKGLGFDIG